MRLAAISLLLFSSGATVSAQRPVPSHAPTTSATPPSAVQIVARVNGAPVTSDRVAAVLSSLIPQESFHRSVGADKMREFRQRALSSAIDEELEYQDGVRRRLVPSNEAVEKAWQQTAAQYGGPAKFEASLRQSGATPGMIRSELARRLVIDASYERVVVDHCLVTKEDAATFFRNNPDRFVEPEQLHVRAITITVDPSSTPDTWTLAKQRAADARKALDGGMTFSEAVRRFSTDAGRENGGDMGFIHRGSLAAPFDAAVERLTVGSYSDVIESLYGYHVLTVSEIRAPQRKTFTEVAEALVNDLSAKRCAEQKDGWLGRLRAAARIEILQEP